MIKMTKYTKKYVSNDHEIINYVSKNPYCRNKDIEKFMVEEKGFCSKPTVQRILAKLRGRYLKQDKNKLYFIHPLIKYPYKNWDHQIKLGEIEKQHQRIQEIETKYGHEPIKYFNQMLSNNIDYFIDTRDNKYFLTHPFGFLFQSLIQTAIMDCFLNNPYNWNDIKEPKDLDFTITIKTKWSKEKGIFEGFLKHKEKCFQDEILYPIGKEGILYFPSIEDHTDKINQSYLGNLRKEILKGKEEEMLNIIALGKQQKINKLGEKQDHERLIVKENCLSLIERAKEELEERFVDKKGKLRGFTYEEWLNKLEELKHFTEKEYLDLRTEYNKIRIHISDKSLEFNYKFPKEDPRELLKQTKDPERINLYEKLIKDSEKNIKEKFGLTFEEYHLKHYKMSYKERLKLENERVLDI